MALVQVGVMEDLHRGVPLSRSLNSAYFQLGLFALIFGGLQVWWISSTLRKRDLARPMSEGEFRKTLERIWAKKI
jgi:hypothetical protein